MKFSETKFWQNYHLYEKEVGNSTTRNVSDGIMILEFLQYYNPTRILEIGVNQGHTTSLFLEGSPKSCVVGIDLKDLTEPFHYDKDRFDLIIHDSTTFDFSSIDKFDLILIDGDHSYAARRVDIINSIKLLSDDGVILLNDYTMAGVASNRDLLKSRGLVPFMQLEQCEFWHKPHCDRSNFLDEFLDHIYSNFIFFYNISELDQTILKVKPLHFFTNELSLTKLILDFYDV